MLEFFIRSGAIISTVGIALFIAFVLVLLIFPVVKSCKLEESDCAYASTAPEPFRLLVQPAYLALSLLVIAAGVFMVRYGRWRELGRTEST